MENEEDTPAMKTIRVTALFAFSLLLFTSSAAPAAKLDPVNENYPAWEGVTPRNYIGGRAIVPSDLRQRVTIVVEFQMEKIGEQLPKFANWARNQLWLTGEAIEAEFSPDWMHKNVHDKAILLLSNRGQTTKNDAEKIEEAAKKLPKTSAFSLTTMMNVPVYSGVTFDGAPDAGGKYPFVYVMGPEGKEPVLKSAVADLKKDELKKAIVAAKKDLPEFKPFYGTVGEPQFIKTLGPAIAKGKPLAPVQKSILAKVKSGNAEEAKEAQRLYDGLEQTKSDLILKMRLEAIAAPFCAIGDFNLLGKYWPAAKKEIAEFVARFQKNPDSAAMGEMYTKMMMWSDPNLKLKKSQAKDIKARLNKFKKSLAPLKESKNITIQNSALMLDAEVDTILSGVDAKVQ